MAVRAVYVVGVLAVALPGCAAATQKPMTIYRDSYGVPSIVGKSYAEAMYGLGYLHFTDAGERAAINYKIARGRSGEVLGRSQMLVDSFLRGFELEEKAEAAKLDPASESIIAAYVAGANRAIAERRAKLPAWIQPIDRTDVLCLVQFVNCAFPLLDLSSQLMPGVGSNQFAIGAKRSSTGHPILSMDPHLDWNGNDGGIVWYEAGIYCDSFNFRGVGIPGAPGCVMGHNDRVAWSVTNNDPQLFVRYQVKTKPDDASKYSYFGEWKPFRTKKIVLRFLEGGKYVEQEQTLKLTDWGPMVPFRSESVFLEPVGNFGSISQLPAMMRSTTVQELRKALNHRGLSMWNFVAADTNGGLAYQYNAFLRHRDATLDWSLPVDGSNPKSKLGELFTMDELPHSVNPRSDVLVNANSAPWLTSTDNSMPKTWPSYVTTYGPTSRYLRLRELLQQRGLKSPTDAQAIATDTLVPFADRILDRLKTAGVSGEGFNILQNWDRHANIDSVGPPVLLYLMAAERKLAALAEPPADEVRQAYAQACEALKKDFGKLDVRWGEVLRMHRGNKSLGVDGWGSILPGMSAAVNPSGPSRMLQKLDGPITASRGSSFRMIVSLVPGHVESWSVLPYGNAQDPESPYYANQMDLFAVGRYKPTLFGVEAAKRGAKETITLQR
jgi:acyl-homoserine lactone acylase PvdQ